MQKITQEEMNGERFQFGENGRAFLYALNEDRINFYKNDLLYFLEEKELTVHTFDYDLDSVAFTEYLKEKHFPNDQNLIVELM